MMALRRLDERDAQRLADELDRIKKECPLFTAWLKSSQETTADALCSYDSDNRMYRETGCLSTLREISRVIDNPRSVVEVKTSDDGGMVG